MASLRRTPRQALAFLSALAVGSVALLPASPFVFGGRGFGSFYGTVAPVFTLTRGEGDAFVQF